MYSTTGSEDQTARLWDVESGAELACLKGHQGAVESASFSLDGHRIVTASRDRTARLWSVERRTRLASLKGHNAGIKSVSFGPEGRRIVSVSWLRKRNFNMEPFNSRRAATHASYWERERPALAAASFKSRARDPLSRFRRAHDRIRPDPTRLYLLS